MLTIKKNNAFTEVTVLNKQKQSKSYKTKDEDKRKLINRLNSTMRSKKMIIDYCLANQWDYFFTITLDKKLIDRTDYQNALTKLKKLFNNYKNRYDKDFKYILIPELHKRTEKNGKKAVHFHGLIKINNISFWKFNLKVIRDMAYVYESDTICKRFGINEFTLIYNYNEFISYYISKYISKNYDATKIGKYRYYHSKDLELPFKNTIIKTDWFLENGLFPTYNNKFCDKYKFSNEEFYNFLKLNIDKNYN